MAAIAEWAADAPQLIRVALGARRDGPAHWVVPSEATIRRTLARLDAETLAEVIGAWLADRDRPDQRRRWAVAVDGRPFGAPGVTAAPFTCWPLWSTPLVGCWPNAPSTAPLARCPASSHCWPTWTWPGRWSRLMHSTPC